MKDEAHDTGRLAALAATAGYAAGMREAAEILKKPWARRRIVCCELIEKADQAWKDYDKLREKRSQKP